MSNNIKEEKIILEEKKKIIAKLYNEKKFQEIILLTENLLKEHNDELSLLNAMALGYKGLGKSEKSKEIYQKILQLELNPNLSYVYSNAGNLFLDLGEVDKAVECHNITLRFDKNNLNSINGIGLAYVNSGKGEEAIKCFKQALSIDPKDDYSNFNLGNVYRIKRRFKEAINCYEYSDRKLSKSNQLECIYKDNDESLFNEKLRILIDKGPIEPLIAALSSHASIRFSQKDEYPFCPDPMNFIHNSSVYDDERFNDELIGRFLNDINNAKISKKVQSLLVNGVQSSGDLFLHNFHSVNLIKEIINDYVNAYRTKFSNKKEQLIMNFPKNYKTIGWIVIMKSGGNLAPHMHKEGWLSGSIYLQIPKKKLSNDGNIEIGLHGGEYPSDGKKYPSRIVDINKGNIVMFPSSLFHSTLPFKSKKNRVTLAFDVVPLV